MKKVSNTKIEIITGLFVLIGIICVSYLTIKLGKMEIVGSDNNYELFARFQSVSGLKIGADVEIAGVKIGKVDAISFDIAKKVALIKMRIIKDIVLSDDSIVSVKTSGLIGDKYIRISPGGSDLKLKHGSVVTETESALDIEELISKYVFGKM